jgi:molybdopterin-guanine dinucleotide biosynthesis protein A
MPEQTPLKGLVLAGGQSVRMGADKAAVEFAGAALLDRAVAALTGVVTEVYVSARVVQSSEGSRGAYPLIVDQHENIGPAAGILAAHVSDPAAAWLVIACDMPLLDKESLAVLRDGRAHEMDATCLIVAELAPLEPLCAIYEPGTLARFQALVEAGGNTSPRAWLANANTRRVVAPGQHVLRGANTGAELAELKIELEAAERASGRKQQ